MTVIQLTATPTNWYSNNIAIFCVTTVCICVLVQKHEDLLPASASHRRITRIMTSAKEISGDEINKICLLAVN